MKKTAKLMICGIILFFCRNLHAQNDLTISSYRDSIFCALKKQEYSQAKTVLSTALYQFPENLEFWYLSFAIEQARILDFESYALEGEAFIISSKKLKKKFEYRLKSLEGNDLVMCQFYIANIIGGISIIQAKSNNWIEAAKNAHQAVTDLRGLTRLHPDFNSAFLGIGMFDYYINKGLKKIIPFVQNKGPDAIKLLTKAVDAPYPFNEAAKSSLCWVLIDSGNLKKADSVAMSVLSLYPDHSIFLRIRAQIALWSGKYTLAHELGCKLLLNAESRHPLNYSDIISASYIMIYSCNKLGYSTDALIACDNLLIRKIPSEYTGVSPLDKNLKYIIETRENLTGCEKIKESRGK